MEAFSLLKYWRGAGGGGNGGDVVQNRPISTVATIVTAVGENTAEIDGDDDDDDDDIGGGGGDDDGPFFDLEFAVNEEDEAEEEEEINTQNREEEEEEEEEAINDDDDDDDEEEREFKFTLSSGSSNDRTDTNLALSPSDDLFFKGKLVPIESSSSSSSSEEEAKANDNNNNLMKPTQQQAQFPVSLLKSATKFRVFMLGLKKSKSNALANNNGVDKTEQITKETAQKEKETPEKTQQQKSQKNQFFTVKLKVEEVPIVSLFSSRSVSNKSQKQSNENETASVSTDEKRFAKEVVQKYLKMVKPLYVRVSKRYGERLKLSGQVSLNSSGAKPVSPPNTTETVEKKSTQTVEPPPPPPPPPESAASSEIPANNVNKSLNFPAGLRVVCKHLGKSRSASSTAAVAPSGTAAQAAAAKRRDDSLLQQQDGIQSAILHCKRSFNAARDSESNLLSRCASDPSK